MSGNISRLSLSWMRLWKLSGPNLGSLNFEPRRPTLRRSESKSGSDSFMFSHKIFLLPAQGVRQ